MSSRIIKKYPYCDKFKDEIQVSASTIKTLRFPGAYIEGLSFNAPYAQVLTLSTKTWALEDGKGIHMQVVEKNKSGEETGLKSKVVILEEEKFCDTIYQEACINERSAENIPYIRDIIYDLIKDIAINQIKGDIWLCGVDYDGHGVICSGNDIIGTVDRITFEKGTVILTYCVGNADLDNIKDCNVKFNVNNRSVILTKLKVKSVKSVNDYFCTYVLDSYEGKYSEGAVVDDNLFRDFVPFSEENAERFVEERNALICFDDESNDKSYIDDLL